MAGAAMAIIRSAPATPMRAKAYQNWGGLQLRPDHRPDPRLDAHRRRAPLASRKSAARSPPDGPRRWPSSIPLHPSAAAISIEKASAASVYADHLPGTDPRIRLWLARLSPLASPDRRSLCAENSPASNIDALAYFGARYGGARSRHFQLADREQDRGRSAGCCAPCSPARPSSPRARAASHDNTDGVTFEQGTDYGLLLEETPGRSWSSISRASPAPIRATSRSGPARASRPWPWPISIRASRYRNEPLKRARACELRGSDRLDAQERRAFTNSSTIAIGDANPTSGSITFELRLALARQLAAPAPKSASSPPSTRRRMRFSDNAHRANSPRARNDISTRDWSSLLGFGGRYLATLNATN